MSKRICTFIDNWLTEFKTWLEKVSSSKAAYCKLRQLSFDVSNMERINLKNKDKPKKKKKKKILESLFKYHFSPQIILDY